MPKTIPPVPGMALMDLRVSAGCTQAELAARMGTAPSVISAMESGARELSWEKLYEAAGHLKRDKREVEQALWNAGLLLPAAEGGALWPGELAPGQRREIARAAAHALRLAAHALEGRFLRFVSRDVIERDRRLAARFCEPLQKLSVRGWRGLFEALPHRLSWAVVEWLAEHSTRVAAHDAKQAVALADLAVELASRVPEDARFRQRLEGYCRAALANARRVANDLRGAEATFAEAWRLWKAADPGERGPLDIARLLDLEASLRRDQRRFREALELLERALARRPGGVAKARLLLKKGATLEQMHDHEAALEAYAQAEPLIDGRREPRLSCVLQFNRTVALCHLGRLAEAQPLYLEARVMAERLQLKLDRIRSRWLDAKLGAAQGRILDALEAFEEVRQELVKQRLPADAALVMLEMALLLAGQGRTAEVRVLAERSAPLFAEQGIDREALACFVLFRQAAAQEAVTAELVLGLIERLKEAARRG